MKWLIEVWLHFAVAADAELRLTNLQHCEGRKISFLGIGGAHKGDRPGNVSFGRFGVRRMAVSATDIIAPVFTTAEVIAFLLACVAGQTSLRDFFRGFVLERNDLGGITLLGMFLTGAVTRFTASDLILPTAYLRELCMRSM